MPPSWYRTDSPFAPTREINRAVFESMHWPAIDSYPGLRVYKPRTTSWRGPDWAPADDLNETAIMEREIAAMGQQAEYRAALIARHGVDAISASAIDRCKAWLSVVGAIDEHVSTK